MNFLIQLRQLTLNNCFGLYHGQISNCADFFLDDGSCSLSEQWQNVGGDTSLEVVGSALDEQTLLGSHVFFHPDSITGNVSSFVSSRSTRTH